MSPQHGHIKEHSRGPIYSKLYFGVSTSPFRLILAKCDKRQKRHKEDWVEQKVVFELWGLQCEHLLSLSHLLLTDISPKAERFGALASGSFGVMVEYNDIRTLVFGLKNSLSVVGTWRHFPVIMLYALQRREKKRERCPLFKSKVCGCGGVSHLTSSTLMKPNQQDQHRAGITSSYSNLNKKKRERKKFGLQLILPSFSWYLSKCWRL